MRFSHFLLVSSAMCLPLAAAMSISISYEALAAKSAPTAQTAVSKSTADSGKGDFVEAGGKDGKKEIILGQRLARVQMGPDYEFVPADKAQAFLKRQGSNTQGVLGIFVPRDQKQDFLVVCRFEDVGYVNDDDADKLNANEILESYKEGTKAQNEERADMKLPPIFVGDWAEKPRYDKAKHQVVWAIQVKEEDKAEAPVVDINYNTRMLGRRGVLSMNLITGPDNLEENKGKIANLLKETSFIKGHSYAEYVPGKDKAAGYGLAGLILGGGAMAAAAKFGVLGGLWKWALGLLLVMKKFIIVIIAAGAAAIGKLFGRKKAEPEAAPVNDAAPADPSVDGP